MAFWITSKLNSILTFSSWPLWLKLQCLTRLCDLAHSAHIKINISSIFGLCQGFWRAMKNMAHPHIPHGTERPHEGWGMRTAWLPGKHQAIWPPSCLPALSSVLVKTDSGSGRNLGFGSIPPCCYQVALCLKCFDAIIYFILKLCVWLDQLTAVLIRKLTLNRHFLRQFKEMVLIFPYTLSSSLV